MSKRITTESFVQRANEIHSNKYDYSKVAYQGALDKVCIVCPEHGEFWQRPMCHLNGQGCPACAGVPRYNTQSYIEAARKVHGDRYDYSKVEYINKRTKICIICPEHGEFWQSPSSHLKKANCPICAGQIRYTKEDFLEKARLVHGDKYDYSLVEFVNMDTKVCIICPKHGEFIQAPAQHVKGAGCQKCIGRDKTTSDFILEAYEVHGTKYDYSKVDYVNASTKICIICPDHGEFWQLPNSHLSGNGCKHCGRIVSIRKKTNSQELFVRRAKAVHGDKYDYSKVNYIKAIEKVCIICPTHGEFWQEPYSHLRGYGCSSCTVRKTTEEFIDDARAVHGDKYDYSKTDYVSATEKVCIICLTHGEFWQTPSSHLSGHNCPKCSGSYMDTEFFIEKARLVHGDKYDYSKAEYYASDKPLCIICSKHGEFWQRPNGHLRGAGCPICNSSSLEEDVRKELLSRGLSFTEQKTFSWLRYKGLLRVDFYLDDLNIVIECQGIQHFKPIEAFGGEEEYQKVVRRDQVKLKLCSKHNVPIVYYSNSLVSGKKS